MKIIATWHPIFKVKCFKWTFGDIKLTLSQMKTCNLEMIRKLAYVDNYYSDHLYNSRVKELKNWIRVQFNFLHMSMRISSSKIYWLWTYWLLKIVLKLLKDQWYWLNTALRQRAFFIKDPRVLQRIIAWSPFKIKQKNKT